MKFFKLTIFMSFLLFLFMFCSKEKQFQITSFSSEDCIPLCGRDILMGEIRKEVSCTQNDGQEGLSGRMDNRVVYMEMMRNWFTDEAYGAVRFENLSIPNGAAIDECYLSVCPYSTQWLCSYCSTAAFDDSDTDTLWHDIGPPYSRYLSSRWNDNYLTSNRLLWHESMRKSSVVYDSTPNMAAILQEIVDRQDWNQYDNAITFVFKTLAEWEGSPYADSCCGCSDGCHSDPDSVCAAYEWRVFEDINPESLIVKWHITIRSIEPPELK